MQRDLNDISVSSRNFPGRVHTAFKRAGLLTLGQIERMTDDDLLGLHGIGQLTVLSLRRTLSEIKLAA